MISADAVLASRTEQLVLSFEEALSLHQQHLRETLEAAAPPPPYIGAPESTHGPQAMIGGDLAYVVMSRPPYRGE